MNVKIYRLFDSRFFQQEIILAAKNQKSHFFIAPYCNSPQLAYFMKEKLVHAVCGSPVLFLYDAEQVIIDFDISKGSFQFLDRSHFAKQIDIPKAADQKEFMAKLFIYLRCFPQHVIRECEAKTPENILQDLKEQKDLPEKKEDADLLGQLKNYLLKYSVILKKNNEIGNIHKPEYAKEFPSEIDNFLGKRFSNDIFSFLARGLLDPFILEMISLRFPLTSTILTPSQIFLQMKNCPEYQNIFKQIFLNLHELKDEEKKIAEHDVEMTTLYKGLGFSLGDNHFEYKKWTINDADINEEIDRQMCSSRVNFVFVLKWIQ